MSALIGTHHTATRCRPAVRQRLRQAPWRAVRRAKSRTLIISIGKLS